MRIISMPTSQPRDPSRPPGWLTWWMPVGTIVEHNGYRWEKVYNNSDADQVWTEWKRLKSIPMPTKSPSGPSGISRRKS